VKEACHNIADEEIGSHLNEQVPAGSYNLFHITVQFSLLLFLRIFAYADTKCQLQEGIELNANMVSLSGFLYHLGKFREDVSGIMGSGGCLRVELDGEGRDLLVPQPFNGVIVQVYVGYLHLSGDAVRVNHEVVVLGCYLYPSGCQIFDGVVSSVVPEFEFVGFASKGKSK